MNSTFSLLLVFLTRLFMPQHNAQMRLLKAQIHILRARMPPAVARLPLHVLLWLRMGFSPKGCALDAYLTLLAEEAPAAPWMIAGLDVDILPLIEMTVARGGPRAGRPRGRAVRV